MYKWADGKGKGLERTRSGAAGEMRRECRDVKGVIEVGRWGQSVCEGED